MKRRILVGILPVLLIILLSGCFVLDPDELLTLPKQAEDYYNLQQAIDEVMKDAEYSAPISGENRQAVQLKDLDGDGNNEAVLFAKTEGEHPLKIYVFNRVGAVFSAIACMEGDGINFDTVQFCQIDGQGGLEIVVSRQLNEGVPQTLSVYATQDSTVTELLNISDNRFVVTDFNADGAEDIFVLHADAARQDDFAELYFWKDNALCCDSLSLPGTVAESAVNLQAGKISGEIPAAFVAGALDETEQAVYVFALQQGRLTNLTAEKPLRIPANWSLMDIDADGELELPRLRAVSALDSSDDTSGIKLVCWQDIDATGTVTDGFVNLHNSAEQWYFTLPDFWQENLLLATRQTGDYSCTAIYQKSSAGDPVQVLALYAYSGEDGAQWATQDGRFLLGSRENTVYAAKITETPGAESLREDAVMARFHLLPDQITVVS